MRRRLVLQSALTADLQPPTALDQDGWVLVKHAATTGLLAESHPDAAAVRVDAPADLGAARANRLTGVRCRRPWATRGRKAGEVSVRMSGASCRASQFGPPVGCFDARSIRGGIRTRTRSGWCRMRPINGHQIGNVGLPHLRRAGNPWLVGVRVPTYYSQIGALMHRRSRWLLSLALLVATGGQGACGIDGNGRAEVVASRPFC